MLFLLENRQIFLADRVVYWYDEYFHFDLKITVIIVIIMGDHNDNSCSLFIVIELLSKRNSDKLVSITNLMHDFFIPYSHLLHYIPRHVT